jgi:hypothetical protein
VSAGFCDERINIPEERSTDGKLTTADRRPRGQDLWAEVLGRRTGC